VLLDHLLVLHDEELHVGAAELLGDAQLGRLGAGLGRRRQQRENSGERRQSAIHPSLLPRTAAHAC
jgi:hypothetical protein